eukprot:jgi/Mesvir1/18543/Mv17062-RA.1
MDAIRDAFLTHNATLLAKWSIDVRSVDEIHMDWLKYHQLGEGIVERRHVDAWCAANDSTPGSLRTWFPCYIPERAGPMCDIPVPAICINQCSGKGTCDRGFCVCQQGYHGVDCSIPAPGTLGGGGGTPKGAALFSGGSSTSAPSYSSSPLLPSAPSWPPSSPSRSLVVGAGGRKMSRQELRLATLKGELPSGLPAADNRDNYNNNDMLSDNDNTANGRADTLANDDGHDGDSSNIAGAGTISTSTRGISTGRTSGGDIDGNSSSSSGGGGGGGSHGKAPSGTSPMAKRPRIYVYELEPVFNSRVLQFRRREYCVSREFVEHPTGPKLRFQEWLYNFDFMLLEWLLHSEHRTLDPEEADYFYVPYLASCYNLIADDNPRTRLMSGSFRMVATIQAAKLVLQHIRRLYPFWDRNNGTDHIWLWLWDEGSAVAPAAIRDSVFLTSWGARYVEPRTAYMGDLYIRDKERRGGTFVYGMAFQDKPLTQDEDGHQFNARGVTWAGDVEERGTAPGYDPDKDIVIPAPYYAWMYSPHSLYNRWRRGHEVFEDGAGACSGCQKYNNDMLFYFGGDLGKEAHDRAGVPGGRPEERYSWGVRQTLAKHYLGEEGRKKGMYLFPGHSDVSRLMGWMSWVAVCL